jgi:hypothetical protein
MANKSLKPPAASPLDQALFQNWAVGLEGVPVHSEIGPQKSTDFCYKWLTGPQVSQLNDLQGDAKIPVALSGYYSMGLGIDLVNSNETALTPGLAEQTETARKHFAREFEARRILPPRDAVNFFVVEKSDLEKAAVAAGTRVTYAPAKGR